MNWLQLGYEYAMGGVFFFVTLWLCFRGGEASALKNPSDRRTLVILLAGFVYYFLTMTVWILLAS